MSPATALLRRLEAATALRDEFTMTERERCERVAAWNATRPLLPLLAGLVEAIGDFMDPEKEDDVDANYQRVERAYATLNAAAAKEVK